MVEDVPPLQACRDPKDDKFLALATHARCTALVSGDDDWLDLNPSKGFPSSRLPSLWHGTGLPQSLILLLFRRSPPDSHDGLPGRLEFAGQLGDAGTGRQALHDERPLLGV
jgi:hypothetical protein